jgi:acetyl-CoA carboxylase biotin carboxyl carrier protein
MTLDEIRSLVLLVTETGIAELELQRGENRVRIRRAPSVQHTEVTVPYNPAPTVQPAVSGSSAPAASPAAMEKPVAATPAKVETVTEESKTILVKSPIVGTFYESPSPGAAPFVRIGEAVQPGKVLCIIESMKLMNEIEAEVAGVVTSKLVQNGQPVEYGEALFALTPL